MLDRPQASPTTEATRESTPARVHFATPNDDWADPLVSDVSAEQNGTMTDPLGTGWFDSEGFEGGAECALEPLFSHYFRLPIHGRLRAHGAILGRRLTPRIPRFRGKGQCIRCCPTE